MSEQPSIDLENFHRLAAEFQAIQTAVGDAVFGQDDVIAEVVTGLLAGGHVLLVGAPGLAKTRLVKTVGHLLGLDTGRIQFTPDLMPSDILGTEILDTDSAGDRSFRFIQGPVFCQLLMADEINRASPRTQSALLEAMQEGQVTIAGEQRPLPAPFHVLATQNPIEQEGTYPLPEAQLDRFVLQSTISYPDKEAEARMVLATTGAKEPVLRAPIDAQSLSDAQMMIRHMPLGENLMNSILDLVRLARPEGAFAPHLQWGPGPRASQALSLTMRARAFLMGRTAPTHEDLAALAPAALRHRMALTFAARAEGQTIDGMIVQMLKEVV